jgi:hypothetical protein
VGTETQDLLTVANASFDIRNDQAAYDFRTREDAWALWCIALNLLRSNELRRTARQETRPQIRCA